MRKKILLGLFLVLGIMFFSSPSVKADVYYNEFEQVADVYRIYNPNNGDHIFTIDNVEKNNLVRAGWRYEGVVFTAATTRVSHKVIMRFRNPNTGKHHFTTSEAERTTLLRLGWQFESVPFTEPFGGYRPVYRLYNPNAGNHFLTTSESEKASLMRAGWKYETIEFYAR